MTPLRAGALGVSTVAVVGAVAVGSGLVPGLGDGFGFTDDGPATSVRAEDSASGTPGASEGAGERDGEGASRGEARSASPSAEPSTSAKPSETPSKKPAEQSSAPPETKRPAEPEPDRTTKPAPTPAAPKPEAPPSKAPTTPGDSGVHSAAEARVLALVNQERGRAGCGPVRADAELAKLAGDYSRDMAVRGFFSHTDPDGRSPWDRADDAGVDHMGGENIARGQADAEAVMDAWMNSTGHRDNILNCDFTTLGVGAHFAGGGPWWTQAFGY
ncbi:CAP domain-containing protein [Streptomyces chumphonensis]|uniref:CAP domain-containing protein n=1 Tax=Streptomyces chumphonensis TaxID=1214925 RepID=A0A927F336_9ACTN|nr:CAP domain-containing protein [Streptomyces chumphonensis]MBD3934638.1 CAP domain-containing protein [Streptomyces chumphonensis]